MFIRCSVFVIKKENVEKPEIEVPNVFGNVYLIHLITI